MDSVQQHGDLGLGIHVLGAIDLSGVIEGGGGQPITQPPEATHPYDCMQTLVTISWLFRSVSYVLDLEAGRQAGRQVSHSHPGS